MTANKSLLYPSPARMLSVIATGTSHLTAIVLLVATSYAADVSIPYFVPFFAFAFYPMLKSIRKYGVSYRAVPFLLYAGLGYVLPLPILFQALGLISLIDEHGTVANPVTAFGTLAPDITVAAAWGFFLAIFFVFWLPPRDLFAALLNRKK